MRVLEILLRPFSWLYGSIMMFRNFLYDRGIRKSFHFDSCVISVGNLSVGGSGKTPMVEYLIRLLGTRYNIATLSRGYGRKTRGFRLAGKEDSAVTVGDEPFQYFTKFPEITVTVGEQRALAIPFILAEAPQTDLIIMDDAFQHRAVSPDLQILVTDYSRPFYTDMVLPAGRLREPRSGARRADVIVISKCPLQLPAVEMENIRRKVAVYSPGIPVYFTTVNYEPLQSVTSGPDGRKILLVTGIAHPQPLATYLGEHYELIDHLVFPDHHPFGEKDILRISRLLKESGAMLVTTEKDLMRFMSGTYWDQLRIFPVCFVPIKVRFLIDADKFEDMVLKVVESRCS